MRCAPAADPPTHAAGPAEDPGAGRPTLAPTAVHALGRDPSSRSGGHSAAEPECATYVCKQEMAAPELQPLALEAKSGAAVLKYLPVTATQVAQVVSAVEAVSHHDQWPARAAALVFVQVAAHAPCVPQRRWI